MKYWKTKDDDDDTVTCYYMQETAPIRSTSIVQEMTLKEWNTIYMELRPKCQRAPKGNITAFMIAWNRKLVAYRMD